MLARQLYPQVFELSKSWFWPPGWKGRGLKMVLTLRQAQDWHQVYPPSLAHQLCLW